MAVAHHVLAKLACLSVCVVLLATASAHADDNTTFARKKLTLQLQDARTERAHTTRLWPLVTLGAGASAVLTGTVVGTARVLSCDTSCSAPSWVSLAVVIGAAVGSVGAVWLIKTNADIHEEDSRIERIERDLERQQHSEIERRVGTPSRPLFNLHFVF